MTDAVRRATWLAAACLGCLLAGCRLEPIRVESFELEGVERIDEDALRQVLATRDPGWLPFAPRPPFSQEAFERDLRRIEAYYHDHGFPDARVLESDVRFDEAHEDVRIVVRVEEGAPVVVSDIRFDGFDVLPQGRVAFIRRSLDLEPGDVRDRQAVLQAAAVATSSFKDAGYPYATVETRDEPAEGERAVVVVFEARPGPLATFGDVTVQGNESVSEAIVRRQLAFEPGQRYSLSRVEESQRELQSLELFSFAYVEPRGGETQETPVPIRVTVAEGKPQRATFGVGYGTEDKARARVNWRHVNFLGDARTANAEAKWSSLDRGVRFGFAEPYLFSPQLSLTAEGQVWDENEPVYRVQRYGGRLAVTWERLRRNPLARRDSVTSVTATYNQEYTDYTVADFALADPSFAEQLIALGLDPVSGENSGMLAAIRLEALRDTSGRTLDPQRGYLARLAYERAGGLLPGRFEYDELTAEGRYYLPAGRAVVVAARARIGGIDAPDLTTVPFFKRYFLGGSTSLRGWGRFEVSPLTESGIPVGGLTMFESSVEARVPVAGNLGMVAFVDAGNVWPRRWDIDFGDLLADVGAGVRYSTPIGPVRADVGYQLTPVEGLIVDGEPETRRWRIHVSIGQAF
jgi:outer membrane protein insertion porin family/translocation and assembly module TamA